MSRVHQIFILKHFSECVISHDMGFRFNPKEYATDTADPKSTPFPMSEVVGRPPTLSTMALMMDIPGDRCSSE
jgi:hypothetical protein